jgi:UDP-N-acetylglucosamine 2-epimerase (non-hydrolysing)
VARDHAVAVVHVGAGVREPGLGQAANDARKGTDAIADLLYTSDVEASHALAAESIAPERIHCVGSLLVDAVRLALGAAPAPRVPRVRTASAEPVFAARGRYAVVAVEHPLNLADRRTAGAVLDVLHDVGRDVPLVWPIERGVRHRIRRLRLEASLEAAGVSRVRPQSYVDHIALLRGATCVLTDSWDVQDESTALAIPCITIGVVPARSITVTRGSNTMVGCDRVRATRVVWDCIFNGGKRGEDPDLWDGRAGARIASYLVTWLRSTSPAIAYREDPK